ncbi:MAG: SDR family NAD(P)-dependent oxidoreductase [Microthrixaceae bacterium]
MQTKGSVALITGGSSGLGLGTAKALIDAGAQVFLADREPPSAEVLSNLGPRASYVHCDVTDEASVVDLLETVSTEGGRLDLLVSCAGISIGKRVIDRQRSPMPLDLFRRHIDVNLIGLFDVLRHASSLMALNEASDEGERGLIVNVASIAAFDGQAGQSAYSASKGAVAAMTLPLARDLAPVGIRVMCICPGTMDTPMLATLPAEAVAELADGNLFPKRLGTPSDLGELVIAMMQQTFLNAETVRLDAGLRLAPR